MTEAHGDTTAIHNVEYIDADDVRANMPGFKHWIIWLIIATGHAL